MRSQPPCRAAAIVLAALLASSLACLAGCGGVLPGFRFAAAEEQKQTAQVGADLAGVAATAGLPPQSLAAARLAQAARAGSAYAGPPSEPIDVADLVPPAVTRAWDLMERRAEAFETRAGVLDRTAELTAEALAGLAADIEGCAKVDADRVVFRAAAIVQGQALGAELAGAIPVPDPLGLSPEESARMARLDAALKKIQTTAAAQAARRPTTAEVVDAAEDQALDVADRIFGALDDYGLSGLLGATGLGGVALAVRSHKQKKKAAEDLKFARVRETQAAASAAEAVSAAQAQAAAVATAALEKLAAAQPPVEG